jgi:aminopeptidase YwaD
MKSIIYLIILLFTFSISFGQRDYGLKIVEELCSEKYHGRGYVNKGHVLAADYIAQEMKNLGLKPLSNKGYLQHFYMDVNTFPNEISITIGDSTLVPGIDFIVDPKSGSADGTFKVNYIETLEDIKKIEENDKANKPKKAFVTVIVAPSTSNIDTNEIFRQFKLNRVNYGPVIWLTDKKLTYSVGNQAYPYPIYEVKKECFHSSVEEVTLSIKNEFIPNLKSQNVIGMIEGKKANKTIVLSAHYDHLGRMGKEAYFPGANDNASGVAMLLYMAQYFSKNQPPFNIVFMAFGGEEAGLLGSKHYVTNPLFPLKDIHFLLNLDIMGTGEEGITVVNGAVFKKQFATMVKINKKKGYLAKVKVRGKAANSDHYFFSEAGVPAFFVYTMGGVSYYHDVFDQSKTLPLNEFDSLFLLFRDFILKV